MNTHTIRANEGWESQPMSFARALIYAEKLRRMGNYHVVVKINR